MASCKFIGIQICSFFIWAACSIVAFGQDDSTGYRLLASNDDSPLLAVKTVETSPCAGGCDINFTPLCRESRWTASAEFIILDRSGSQDRTLVERVPGSVPLQQLSNTVGVEALNANDFHQGFAGGPRIGLIRHGDNGYDLELSYFQIDGWSSERTIGPDNPPDWLVMRAPGGFLQTQDHDTQAMTWGYSTKLYNAELNLQWHPRDRVTIMAGFRWLDLKENLVGTLNPSEGFPPYWNTTTNNNLYGFQIGAAGTLWQRGRFSIDGLIKAGIYDNNAEQSTGVSIFKVVRPSSASINRGAFVGEIGLQGKYQFSKKLAMKTGYQAIWLQGVALAPGQIQETLTIHPSTVQALGVNCDSGLFFHGATVGLEYSF